MEKDENKGFTEQESKILNGTSTTINIISAVCLCILLILYPYLVRRYPKHMDRTSLRLVTATAVSGVLFCVLAIESDLMDSPTVCSFSVWGYIATGLMCLLFAVSIAINLHIVFLLEYPASKVLERIYVVGTIAISLALPTPTYLMGEFGWTDFESSCWFKSEGTMQALFLAWGVYYLWLFLAVIYCLYVTTAVFWKLKGSQFHIRSMLRYEGPVVEEKEGENPLQGSVLSIVASVAIYPAVPILTQSTNILHGTYVTFTKRPSFWLLLFNYICTSMQGVLLLIVFLMDANIRYSLECRRKEIVAEYFDISKADGIIKAKKSGSWLVKLFFLRKRDVEDEKPKVKEDVVKPEPAQVKGADGRQKNWLGVSFAGPQQGESRDEYWGRMAVEFL